MSRWPIIRHIRWVFHSYLVRRWARHWAEVGIGLGVPNDADLAHLGKIRKGEA